MSDDVDDKSIQRRNSVRVITKGIAGTIPFVGPLSAEIIDNLLPDLRLKRLEAFFAALEDRLSGVERIEEDRIQTLSLFEDAVRESARTPDEEKVDYYARLAALGIEEGEEESLRLRKVVRLLASLDIDQIRMLMSYSRKFQHDHDFFEENADILTPPRRSVDKVKDDKANDAFDMRKSELVRLRLLQPKIKQFKRGETPEFDRNTGLPVTSGYELSGTGRMILRYLGILEKSEF